MTGLGGIGLIAPMRVAPAVLDELRARLGPRGMLEGADARGYDEDWRGLFTGHSAAVLRPADTAELARAVGICAAHGVAIVPQGGNTSLVGGATPPADGSAVVISLARMDRVRGIDAADRTMVVEAGVTLQAAQAAADAAGCRLPLSISSEGSARIGGVLATNAGGNNTLRFGNARELVLGLEVVLPDGQVWNGLRRLRKDNTGYSLRHLFVGSEGTLGIISAAVLQLQHRAVTTEVALCALPDVEAALALLARLQAQDAAALQAFEYMSAESMALVLSLIEGATQPLAAPCAHYALIELSATRQDAGLRAGFEQVLASSMEDGLVLDAVLAESHSQRAALWRLREEHSEAQRRAGVSVKNDISVPVPAIPQLLARAGEAVRKLVPGVRVAAFGHLGDGNIHLNLVQPEGGDPAAFMARGDALMDAVNAVVRELGGSFSAEHGVGQLKTGMLAEWRGGAELDLMRRIKQAIDPAGIMNPGKLLAETRR